MAKKFSLWDKKLKEFKKKKQVKDKHYSSFWWDSDWSEDSKSRFNGLGDVKSNAGDMVKLIKLTNYQRAIGNFVKIVTKQDIPVIFGGDQSKTNGKKVIISSDISDKNFDVAVGLALHEGAHIKLTDFEALPKYLQSNAIPIEHWKFFKGLVNILEDRRIDDYIFKSSPGYKAYYHKMYSHYFESENIAKGLMSKSLRDPSNMSHYDFHLTNMTNPVFDRNALPGLSKIVSTIDLRNISRLDSTQAVISLAYDVYSTVLEEVKKAQQDPQKAIPDGGGKDDMTKSGDGSQDSEDSDNYEISDKSNQERDSGDQDGQDKSDDGDSEVDGENNEMGNGGSLPELSASELEAVNKAFEQQRKFAEGDIKKKTTTSKLQKQLEQVSQMGLDVQAVGEGKNSFKTIIYDVSGKNYFRTLFGAVRDFEAATDPAVRENLIKQVNDALKMSIPYSKHMSSIASYSDLPSFMRGKNKPHVLKGFELGALLGRKLMVRNEERSLVYNRLVSGHIDQKRLSHAGYGVETVFKQIHIDRYKQACLHISLDQSSSMHGSKWHQTVQMTSAIVKAATYVQNLRIQVSLRTTTGSRGSGKDTPVLIWLYDSKVNDLNHFIDTMSAMDPSATTPEGLCFDALLRQNMLMPSSSECTSYFLNISDGYPGMGGWGGTQAIEFTRKMVNKMRNDRGINVLSFFVDEGHAKSDPEPSSMFKQMYGKDSRKVSANNVTQIARELNAKFLSEGKYTA